MNKKYKTRGIRGAVTVEENSGDGIKKATLCLLNSILEENKLEKDDIISAMFTVTHDLNADFPAKAARIHLSWNDIPMMCSQEIPVPNSLAMCIRVLVLINTTLERSEIKHVYLDGAKNLRPDL
jgi:chorismate mutase